MLFNSYEFIFAFLPVAVIGFFAVSHIKHEYSTMWLVLASLFFYGWWDYHYVPLLCVSICFNYIVGRRLENLADGYKIEKGDHVTVDMPHVFARKMWLLFGVVINLALLGYFKYMDFFLGTINSIAGSDIFDLPHIILPLGISFYTFTQTAYLVDAYRGQAKNASFIAYCEFVTIFPHLIAGPIINHRDMIPQFIADKTFTVNWENMARGLTLFTMGLFKKVVIADGIAPIVNDIFSRTDALTCIDAWAGALGYTMQLYFDFSGYSEMAIALGLMINLRLPVNFNSPYKSLCVIDFWRRWHMTLGLWVRDYLYIPMGGDRCSRLGKLRNLFLSMLIIGLWHGAGWTFVFWGGLHGIMLMINHLWREAHIKLPNIICWLLTFGGVMVCWVFFRAENFSDAYNVIATMANLGNIMESHNTWVRVRPLVIMMVLTCVTVFAPNPMHLMEKFKPNKKWLVACVVAIAISLYFFSRITDFLYFQF